MAPSCGREGFRCRKTLLFAPNWACNGFWCRNCPFLHRVAEGEDSGAEKHSFLHLTGLATDSGAKNCLFLHRVAEGEDSGAEKHSLLHRTGLATDFGAENCLFLHRVAEGEDSGAEKHSFLHRIAEKGGRFWGREKKH